jgi:hypothetical protein
MTSANEEGAVQAALQEALRGDTPVDPQTTDELSSEVKAAEEPSSEAKAEDTPEVKEPKDGAKSVPYDRFSEVVKQKNDAVEKIKSLEGQFDGASKREKSLQDRIDGLETEHQIVKAIRELAQDERYRPHVVALDKALQGVDDEVEAAKESGSVDLTDIDKAKAEYDEKLAGLADQLATQRAEVLWDQTNAAAKVMIDALPEEYSKVDRTRLQKSWIAEVDWNDIEEFGREAIPENLEVSFAKLIKEYGTPQGIIAKNAQREITKDNPEALKPPSPEVAVKTILEKDWSGTNESGEPLHSEDEFSAAFADLMRKTRQSRE